jgi:AcrR family transcriptional regulator
MANFTEKAIKESFLKLLNERPLNKISVKAIVEDCGINRNSFYYHFQDIPTLLEQIVAEVVDEIIEKYPTITSIDECFNAAFSFALQNKRAAYNIYHSVSRDVFEREVMKLCDYAVTTYVNTVFADENVEEYDKKILVRFIKCEYFGLIIDWLDGGMDEDAINELLRVTELFRGLPDELIRRSKDK